MAFPCVPLGRVSASNFKCNSFKCDPGRIRPPDLSTWCEPLFSQHAGISIRAGRSRSRELVNASFRIPIHDALQATAHLVNKNINKKSVHHLVCVYVQKQLFTALFWRKKMVEMEKKMLDERIISMVNENIDGDSHHLLDSSS